MRGGRRERGNQRWCGQDDGGGKRRVPLAAAQTGRADPKINAGLEMGHEREAKPLLHWQVQDAERAIAQAGCGRPRSWGTQRPHTTAGVSGRCTCTTPIRCLNEGESLSAPAGLPPMSSERSDRAYWIRDFFVDYHPAPPRTKLLPRPTPYPRLLSISTPAHRGSHGLTTLFLACGARSPPRVGSPPLSGSSATMGMV